MPVQLLLSRAAAERFGPRIDAVLAGREHRLVCIDDPEDQEPDIALLTRDVTGRSTKSWHTETMDRFCRLLEQSPRLRWVHIHAAGTDRPIYPRLMSRGVTVTTSSGANAATVSVSVLGGVIALARRFPAFMDAQRRHAWEQIQEDDAPRDLAGQTALVVGLGPIGREIARLLRAIGMRIVGARRTPDPVPECDATIGYGGIDEFLPRADWLVLACPLSAATRDLIDARRLALLPAGARIVNVSRGEVVVEEALIEALASRRLGGAWLDVFRHEPLDKASPLWDLPNVMISPHTSSRSQGNYDRVGEIFLDNLARWRDGRALRNTAAISS